MKSFWLGVLILSATASSLALAEEGSIDKINGSIRVEDGKTAGTLSTVNGSIRVGEKATVGAIDTVNGSIGIGNDATAKELENVNGSITLGERSRIDGDVEGVNGAITLEKGADVKGSIENVNGKIKLEGAHVGGGIRTNTGDIEIGPNSKVEKGIHVEKPSGGSWFSWGKPEVPRVVIGPGAVVEGTLRFDREVHLFVSDKATIGQVVGAKAVKFSGEQPND